MIIRNDDVAFDTDLDQLRDFCRLCDRYGFPVMQCITPIGSVQRIHCDWDNQRIIDESGINYFCDNEEVYRFILSTRRDIVAAHGLWHTHRPTNLEMVEAIELMQSWGLSPTYIVQPFNEASEYGDMCQGRHVLGANNQRLEDYLPGQPLFGQVPTDKIVYLHSWRFGQWYPMQHLELCLQTIRASLNAASLKSQTGSSILSSHT